MQEVADERNQNNGKYDRLRITRRASEVLFAAFKGHKKQTSTLMVWRIFLYCEGAENAYLPDFC